MDWTKAKSILIVALILTNLVLIFSYAFREEDMLQSSDTILADTIDHLESKNIYIRTEIPEKYGRMPVLYVEYDKMDMEQIVKELADQQPVVLVPGNDEQMIQLAISFIEKCGLYSEHVAFDNIKKNQETTTVSFKNNIDGIQIEDSYIICDVAEDGRIVRLDRYWLEPVEYGKMKKQITSASRALIKFMSEKEGEERAYIDDISLIYWLDSDSFETQSPISDTAFPTWKITYNGGKTQYIVAHEQ